MDQSRDIRCSIYEASPGAASMPLSPEHRPRRPEQASLYRIVAEHWPAFLEARRSADPDGDGVPVFVAKDVEAYLRCGILAHGFARVRCAACRTDTVVGFSCKSRGVCPSCTARRMHDVAAHLVDRVLPHIPMRQWVFTFPRPVRLALFFDAHLASEILGVCLRALFAWQRRLARRAGVVLGAPRRSDSARSGAITFIQRVGSDLRPNLHFHVLVPDGVFARPTGDPEARPRFHRIDPPSDEDVRQLLARVVVRTLRLLRRRGRLPGQSCLLTPFQASLAMMSPVVGRARASAALPSPRCAFQDGFSLHANVALHENDRAGLERLCAYGARPPLSGERLSLTDDGRVRYRMKRAFSDGTRDILLTPTELLTRLCAVVPPPWLKTVRYHGAFAPHARGRRALVGRHVITATATPPSAPTTPPALNAAPPDPLRPRRLDWADLLRRTHAIDLLVCPTCRGPRRVLAFITHPFAVPRILATLRLPAQPPPRGPPPALPDPWLPGVDQSPGHADPPSRFD